MTDEDAIQGCGTIPDDKLEEAMGGFLRQRSVEDYAREMMDGGVTEGFGNIKALDEEEPFDG